MKILISLSLFQTILLAVLGLRVLGIESRTDVIARAAQKPVATTMKTAQSATDPAIITGPSADEIRAIIREEVAAISAQPATPTHRAANIQTEDKTQIAQTRRLKADVAQSLDYYIGRGAINEIEMANLQMKIARLPTDEQKAMLNRLTEAMNSGELDGRF